MSVTELTPALLLNALKAISTSSSERECTEALVTAAELLQQAVLNKQDPNQLHEMLQCVSPELSHTLYEVLGRAVDFHQDRNGAMLGLWLLPVAISSEDAFSTPVSLGGGLPALRAAAALLEQLQLEPKEPGQSAGWIYPIPALYSAAQLNFADVSTLIQLPVNARSVVRGDLKGLTVSLGADDCNAGGNVVYLPFVAYAPNGQEGVRELSAQVSNFVTKWVKGSLTGNGMSFSTHVSVPTFPQPFSETMQDSSMLTYKAQLRYYLYRSIKNSGIAPQGIVAYLSPYSTPQTGGELVIGISFKSRLTRQVLGTITMQTFTVDALDELIETKQLLRDFGFARVEMNKAPINSLFCQHCGELQVQVPPDAMIDSSTLETPPSLH